MGKCVRESAEPGLSCFLYQKTWFSFAVEYSALLKKHVVALPGIFIVELEDLVSNLSYVQYVTHPKKKQPFASQHVRGFLFCLAPPKNI